ncbi:MAG: DUF1572 family protein [Bacteroidetes bacterium]|nr:DUF1572 family protein [Bacteroidota bacterium]MDA1269435.1 DUF1572 family protein [Bacteroidota bacterium]
MNTKELNLLFQRDINKLQEELLAYTKEETIWHVEQQITNSAGNLVLHLMGNLRNYVGLDLGGLPYERDRDREFGSAGVTRAELLEELDLVRKVVEEVLLPLDPMKLGDQSVHSFFGYPMTVGYFLIHLYGHFNYHLGQINYHRRLLDQ